MARVVQVVPDRLWIAKPDSLMELSVHVSLYHPLSNVAQVAARLEGAAGSTETVAVPLIDPLVAVTV